MSTRDLRVLLSVLIAAGILLLFHFFGNTSDSAAFGSSVFTWMVGMWRCPQYDFSHGWLIPLVSIFITWRNRAQLLGAQRCVFAPGLLVVLLALFLHFVGYRTEQARLSLFALILLLWGIPLYLAGPRVAKVLIFPCAFLLFCIPFTFLDGFSFRLRFVSATLSAFLLNGLSVPVVQVGAAIHSANGAFSLDVADPCSGLRYFISMTALTAVYAYFTQKTLVRQWILFLCAIPISTGANIVRIVGIAIIARTFGQKTAAGVYHNWSGYIVFVAAVLLMVALGYVVDKIRVRSPFPVRSPSK